MRRKLFLIIISILILTLSVLGITYAFMRPQVEEKNEKSNITINACAKVQLKDNGNSINLENSYPMDDEMGLETKPYEFTITSTCDDYVGFNLYLTSLNDNEIEDSNIHFALTSKENTVLISDILSNATNALSEFNNEELNELDKGIKGEHKNIYKVYNSAIPLKWESEYKLYLWLDKDASNETMGKSFKVGLSIKSYNREESLAEYLIKNKDETLIYHDGSIKDDEGNITDANDYSYRYAGSSDEVKNFVCLDGGATNDGACGNGDSDLYRIIGLFKNDLNLYEIKLIKYDYATSAQLGEGNAYKGVYEFTNSYYKGNKDNVASIGGYYWTSNNNYVNEWIDSELRKINLNTIYLNYLKTTKKIDTDRLLTTHTWSLNGNNDENVIPKVMYDNEMNKVKNNSSYPTQTKIVKDKIGLMYASDYGYAYNLSSTSNWSRSLSNIESYTYTLYNWMYMGLYDLTISRNSVNSNLVFLIDFTGYITNSSVYHHARGVRPCFYLTSSVKTKNGDGSIERPYRLFLN